MSAAPPLATIPVGIIVERTKAHHANGSRSSGARSPCSRASRRRRPGPGSAKPPTARHSMPARPRSRCTAPKRRNYRDNLASGAPALWVVLRESGTEPPYQVYLVTADPAEGEAMTETGSDLVETVPMPDAIRDRLAAFVAEHHVEHAFVKRKRDRANPEALGRRPMTRPRDEQ